MEKGGDSGKNCNAVCKKRVKGQHSSLMRETSLMLLLVFTLGMAASCNPSSGGNSAGLIGFTPAQATSGATNGINKNTSNATGAIGRAIANSLVTNALLALFLPAIIALTDPDPTAAYENELAAALPLLFQGDPTVDGNKLTFRPNPTVVCADPLYWV